MLINLTKRKFLTTTLIVTAITLVGSAINFLAQAVLAYKFGTSAAVDAYTYALSLPLFISGLIGIIISYTVVPILAKSHATYDGSKHSGRTLSFAMLVLAAAFALTGLTAHLWQPRLLPPTRSLASYPDLPILIMLAWLVGAMQILISVAVAQLNSAGRPIVAALLGLPTNCVTILVLLFSSDVHIFYALAGMATGAALSAALGFWMGRRDLLPPRFLALSGEKSASTYVGPALWAALTLSCFASYSIVDAVWASRVGEGALASMGYAHRIIIGLGSLVVAGPSALFVPRFALLVEAGDYALFRRFFMSALAFTAVFGGLIAGGLYFFADFVVQILFQRGEFDTAAADTVTEVIRHMAPGMVAMLFCVITLRAVFCFPSAGRAAATMGVSFTVAYAFFSYLLMDDGIVGIATAYSISWIGFFSMLLFFVLSRSKRVLL